MHELAYYVRTYDEDLPAAFCRQLIAGFEQSVAQQYAGGRSTNPVFEHSGWTELDIGKLADPAFLGFFLERIEQALQRYNRDVGLTIAIPYRPKTAKLIMKRYRPGGEEGFQPHFDSIDAASARYMVLLWYLNDVAVGGETAFCDFDCKVAPRTGRLLMFPPFWMFQHAGLPPVSGDKYILSTYMMF